MQIEDKEETSGKNQIFILFFFYGACLSWAAVLLIRLQGPLAAVIQL